LFDLAVEPYVRVLSADHALSFCAAACADASFRQYFAIGIAAGIPIQRQAIPPVGSKGIVSPAVDADPAQYHAAAQLGRLAAVAGP